MDYFFENPDVKSLKNNLLSSQFTMIHEIQENIYDYLRESKMEYLINNNSTKIGQYNYVKEGNVLYGIKDDQIYRLYSGTDSNLPSQVRAILSPEKQRTKSTASRASTAFSDDSTTDETVLNDNEQFQHILSPEIRRRLTQKTGKQGDIGKMTDKKPTTSGDNFGFGDVYAGRRTRKRKNRSRTRRRRRGRR